MTQVDTELIASLEDKAISIKKDLFHLATKIGMAHLGGGLSCTDTAVALYYHAMKVDPKNPKWPQRDRFILSKGHMGFVLYTILADLGFYPKEDIVAGYNVLNGKFGMHPNRFYIPGVEASTGSLGHGLSLAVGLALAARMDKASYRVFCMTGDGELNEGSNWEAIMCGAKYKLGNLVAIVDQNKLSMSGLTSQVMPMDPMDEKWKAFGWDVRKMNGHDMEEIVATFDALPPSDSQVQRKPIVIIAETTKGKGIPFMEMQPGWHIGGLDEKTCAECCELIEATRKTRA